MANSNQRWHVCLGLLRCGKAHLSGYATRAEACQYAQEMNEWHAEWARGDPNEFPLIAPYRVRSDEELESLRNESAF